MADPLSGAAQQGHNGTSPVGDATKALMYDYLERNEDIVDGRKALNKQKRELVAEIEKAGIPKEAWEHFLKTREQAGVIRERIDAAWRKLQEWDAKPVGLQASMDLTAGHGVPDLNVQELKRVDNEGFKAGKAGSKRDGNPYTPGTEAYARFDTAWMRGQAEIAASMGPGAGAADGEKRGRGRPKGSVNKPKEPTPAAPDLAAQELGREDALAGHQDHAARYLAGEPGHADYALGHAEGERERHGDPVGAAAAEPQTESVH